MTLGAVRMDHRPQKRLVPFFISMIAHFIRLQNVPMSLIAMRQTINLEAGGNEQKI
jgi:hypothetical protein